MGEYKPWTKHGRNMDDPWTTSLAAQRLRHESAVPLDPSVSMSVHGTLMYLNLIL